MVHHSLPVQPETICWYGVGFIDWASAGQYYSVAGDYHSIGASHYSGVSFDACVASTDGRYQLLYKRLGTKGLLLKDGRLLREVNRSYYQASAYEYPAAFFEADGRIYLAHCPKEYNRLEFEDVETGEIPTDIPEREPSDVFISRLLISPGQRWLLHQGWFWHPYGVVEAFDIAECLSNPRLLDSSTVTASFGSEISSASFLDQDTVLLAATDEEALGDDPELPPNHLAWWKLQTNELSTPVEAPGKRGTVVVINEELAWDLYEHPKLINLRTGEVVQRWEAVNSGVQNSAYFPDVRVQAIHSPDRGLLVIKTPTTVEIISLA